MASLQQVIEELASLAAGGNTTIGGTVTNTASKPLGPFDLITSLLSSKALRNWAIILVIGSLFETGRRLLSSWWSWLINSFFLTVVFDEDDLSYQWIQLWLSKHPSWKTARNVSITTSNFGLIRRMRDDRITNQKKIAYLPAVSHACSLSYKSRWMQVTRQIELSRGGWSFAETLTLRILARDRNVLTEMMRELQMEYQKARQDLITVYSSRVGASDSAWKRIATRPKRPLSSIILDPGMVDLVVGDARDFLQSKQWYADRGIPFRRGYLLYGTPGAGKTSLIHSIGGKLGLDIYIISLSRSGLDDNRLIELISGLPERCIALMEDIDAAFHHGVNRESTEPANPTEPHDSDKGQRREGRPAPTSATRISLSGLLNALDGIAAQEGRILFATTNKYNVLDPALRRPGRLDLHIEFKHASRYQAEELFRCFYTRPSSGLAKEAKTNKVDLDKSEGGDLGFEDAPVKDLSDLSSSSSSSSSSSASVISENSDTEPHTRGPTFAGTPHRIRPPQLSSDDITKLAVQFAASIPERQMSMASLQGFLMMYKTRPYQAVARISAWVAQELEEGER